MNTIIVRPNSSSQYSSLSSIRAIEFPIWHAITADYFKAIKIIDADLETYTDEQIINKIRECNTDRVIILSTGNHPSSFIQQKEEANRLELLLKEYVKEIINLDTLPFSPCKWNARWDLLDIKKYRCHNWHSLTNNNITQPYGVNYTSISCKFSCDFCVVKSFYGNQFEQRTLERIDEDFEFLAKNNIKNIKIMDELFIFNPKRVELICDDLIKRNYKFNIWAYARIDIMNDKLLKKMRKAGIRWLAFGVESGNERIRKEVMKGSFTNNKIKEVIQMTKDNDICIIGNFIFGFWQDNLDTMQQTLDLALDLQCEFINFYCLSAFPNTKFYEEMKERKVELPTKWSQYAQMSEDFMSLSTQYLKKEEVLSFRDKAFYTYFENRDYQKMIKDRFGWASLNNINKMLSYRIQRKILCQ